MDGRRLTGGRRRPPQHLVAAALPPLPCHEGRPASAAFGRATQIVWDLCGAKNRLSSFANNRKTAIKALSSESSPRELSNDVRIVSEVPGVARPQF